MLTSRSLLSVAALAIAGATLAGCGGSSTTGDAPATSTSARQAAADTPTTCPELRSSKTLLLTFTNKTSDLITLRSEPGWACKEWFSGGVHAGIARWGAGARRSVGDAADRVRGPSPAREKRPVRAVALLRQQ